MAKQNNKTSRKENILPSLQDQDGVDNQILSTELLIEVKSLSSLLWTPPVGLQRLVAEGHQLTHSNDISLFSQNVNRKYMYFLRFFFLFKLLIKFSDPNFNQAAKKKKNKTKNKNKSIITNMVLTFE